MKTHKEIALDWIKANIAHSEFEIDEQYEEMTADEMIDWYAYEMAKFHNELAPATSMTDWIKRNYQPATFFDNHEKQANRYYNC